MGKTLNGILEFGQKTSEGGINWCDVGPEEQLSIIEGDGDIRKKVRLIDSINGLLLPFGAAIIMDEDCDLAIVSGNRITYDEAEEIIILALQAEEEADDIKDDNPLLLHLAWASYQGIAAQHSHL